VPTGPYPAGRVPAGPYPAAPVPAAQAVVGWLDGVLGTSMASGWHRSAVRDQLIAAGTAAGGAMMAARHPVIAAASHFCVPAGTPPPAVDAGPLAALRHARQVLEQEAIAPLAAALDEWQQAAAA
jgi:hypothetical protein